jgi:hypothetical protein
LDLCELVGQRPPSEVDPAVEFFTFEKGGEKTGGGGASRTCSSDEPLLTVR